MDKSLPEVSLPEHSPEGSLPPLPPGPEEVSTATGKTDGLDKCPKCGSTDIRLQPETGMLACLFCRHQWAEEKADAAYGFDSPVHELQGTVIGSGARDIQASVDDVLTLKCQGCGAEVVVNTQHALQARCHWCRQVLSVNEQVPNGAVPDAVLPFRLTHEQAVAAVRDFAGRREFFAHRGFRRDFKPENVVGVYMPYMLVDGSMHARVEGVGERETRRYTRKVSENSEETLYDADVYEVRRDFDLAIDDLTVESSDTRSNMNSKLNTNNVINSILPFDTKEAVRYNGNYLGDFTSEKRDLNVEELKPRVLDQFLSIARAKATVECDFYDRGMRWEREGVQVRGSRWVSIYLPVWLYSYYEERPGQEPFVHYIAVNGRTGETMGSVPLNQRRLVLASLAAGLIATLMAAFTLAATADNTDDPANSYHQQQQHAFDPLSPSDRF